MQDMLKTVQSKTEEGKLDGTKTEGSDIYCDIKDTKKPVNKRSGNVIIMEKRSFLPGIKPGFFRDFSLNSKSQIRARDGI